MSGLEPLIPIAFFFSIAAVIILRGPLGKALGERMAGRQSVAEAVREREALQAELEELRSRVGELEERVDFAERLLAQQRGRNQLGAGG